MLSQTNKNILCVDDDPDILASFKRNLRKLFAIDTALGGEEGLKAISEKGPYSVIVSDMQMPEMNGIQFLSKAKEITPDSVRIMLTGHADISMAIEAVNEGNIFRFLTKPCSPETLSDALQSAVEQYQMTIDRTYKHAIERTKTLENLRINKEEFKYYAHHDALTELPNRSSFIERLKDVIGQDERDKRLLAVLLINLDNFKNINNSFGHGTGDLLLKGSAIRLLGCVSDADSVYRLGGDEFTILLKNIDQESGAILTARRVLNSLSEPYLLKSEEQFTTASVGIAFRSPGEDEGTIIKNAAIAMYHAKDLGRNNYQIFNQSMHEKIVKRLELENNLRKAIDRNELIAYYQPKVDLRSGRIAGMEALIRWQRPNGEIISPAEFLPRAEETGLIVRMDEWMLREACAFTNGLQETIPHLLPESFSVSVNLSARDFERDDLVETIKKIAKESKIHPRHLELEVTESAIILDIKSTIRTINDLRENGFKVSMDDFGTGYSSLGYLRKLPINILKIDRLFVLDLPADPDARSVAKTIVSLARELKLEVVAEGVETQDQLDFLRSIGCEKIQGYFISPPLPGHKFKEFFITHSASLNK